MFKMMKIQDGSSKPFVLNVVRRGMTVLIPLVLVSSIAQALLALPIPGFEDRFQLFMGGFLYTVLSYMRDFTFSYFSVLLVVSISISYVLEKGVPLETSVFAPPSACIAFLLITRATKGDIGTKLGTQGSFWALVIALAATWLYVTLINSKVGRIWDVTVGHDTFFRGAMSALVPLTIVILCSALCAFMLYDIMGVESLTQWLADFIESILNSLHSNFAKVLASTVIIHLLWFFGIHGSNAVEPVMMAHTAVGSDIIFSKTFFDVFVLMGGCGTSVCVLAAIFMFSKRGKLKNIARSATLPVLLNINEIITFGLPIIWNPILFIPFMLVPIESVVIAYGAIKFGIVAPVVSEVMWTTPIFISGYAATNSISGALLQLFIILIGTFTYAPFVRMHEEHERQMIKNSAAQLTEILKQAEASGEETDITERTDTLGVVAKMLMKDLHTAIEERLPYLVYQPQFKGDGSCIGAEALLRWRHPTAGYVYPPLIIYLAQKGGFLSQLEQHIFDMACNAIKQTAAATDKEFKISVNITARSLKWDGLEKCISYNVEKCGIDPHKLWIEITEQDIFDRDTANIEKITRLREHGHKFLIDDFGMGKTSIFYLQSKLFDGVKIDGSLTKTILEDKTSREIVSSVIDLSGKLGMLVVAEYVETKEVSELLDKMGCDYHQGYYFSKPVDLEGFQRILEG